MRVREEVISEIVQQWLAKAEADFGLASDLLSEDRYLSAVGFHSQQAAEKFLKAFLVEHQVEFPKTHKIADLLDLIAPVHSVLAASLRDADVLSPYGAEIRYPGDIPELNLETASRAVQLAAQVRQAIYAALETR